MSFTKPWREVVDRDFGVEPITEKAREVSKRMASRMRGNVRVSTGRIYTVAEMDARRSAARIP